MSKALPIARPLLVVLLAPLFIVSCARKVHFSTSTLVPAAEGDVKVKKDKNNNYALDIEVRNLAEPKRLQVPKNVYVVWAETKKRGVQNLGQLITSTGLFSSQLKASLKTVTPYKPTRVFITAEEAASIQYPGSFVVLNTNSF